MDNATGLAIARQLNDLNKNLARLNDNHDALLKLQGVELGEDMDLQAAIDTPKDDDGSQRAFRTVRRR